MLVPYYHAHTKLLSERFKHPDLTTTNPIHLSTTALLRQLNFCQLQTVRHTVTMADDEYVSPLPTSALQLNLLINPNRTLRRPPVRKINPLLLSHSPNSITEPSRFLCS